MTSSSSTQPTLRLASRWLLALLAFSGTCLACSVPVFRYGLEHWTADPYRIVITHQGPLSPAAQSLVQQLKAAAGRANLAVSDVDLAGGADPQMQSSWKSAGAPAEPWMLAFAPHSPHEVGMLWSGALTSGNIAALVDSPTRQSIARRLGEGESAVFVLLEGGDKASDDAAASLLESRLAYLGSVLELPKLDEQDIRNGLVSLPQDGLRLSFSVLRVSRNDPAEQVFVQMLLATEPDLKQCSGPIAFPVFGQGRALYALVGRGIKHETIDEAASFLIGSCSCQVKEKNPGADLLMSVDWKALLANQSVGLEDLPTAKDIVGGMPETVTITSRAEAAPAPQEVVEAAHETPGVWIALWVALALVCLIAAAGAIVGRKRAR